MRVDSLNYVPTETTLNEYRNRNQTRGIKIEKSSNISSGYGDITKIIKDNKKNRIQSAHPVAKQNKNCNLTTSYTLNNRPQSAKKNMKDYLWKIISIARKRQYYGMKDDIKKLIDIKERYIGGNQMESYHVDEIRAVINRILSKMTED